MFFSCIGVITSGKCVYILFPYQAGFVVNLTVIIQIASCSCLTYSSSLSSRSSFFFFVLDFAFLFFDFDFLLFNVPAAGCEILSFLEFLV